MYREINDAIKMQQQNQQEKSKEVIIALQSGVSVNEELLREASSLVMCTRRHQGLTSGVLS